MRHKPQTLLPYFSSVVSFCALIEINTFSLKKCDLILASAACLKSMYALLIKIKEWCGTVDWPQGLVIYSKPGEIIVGIESIDSCWWSGRNSLGYKGIFPTALVWAVDIDTKEVKPANPSFSDFFILQITVDVCKIQNCLTFSSAVGCIYWMWIPLVCFDQKWSISRRDS